MFSAEYESLEYCNLHRTEQQELRHRSSDCIKYNTYYSSDTCFLENIGSPVLSIEELIFP